MKDSFDGHGPLAGFQTDHVLWMATSHVYANVLVFVARESICLPDSVPV